MQAVGFRIGGTASGSARPSDADVIEKEEQEAWPEEVYTAPDEPKAKEKKGPGRIETYETNIESHSASRLTRLPHAKRSIWKNFRTGTDGNIYEHFGAVVSCNTCHKHKSAP